jgi:CheY-like chemotaxis protein
MRMLCVARHPILSEHLCRIFERFDVATMAVVGMRQARMSITLHDPDIALCDYDLLTPTQLGLWRADRAASKVPIVAVSMTKRPREVTAIEERGVVAFLYLPTLEPESARALFAALRRRRDGVASPSTFAWPGTTSVVRSR